MLEKTVIDPAKKAVCFYVDHNISEWPAAQKEKILEIIEAEKERETMAFSIRKQTGLDTLFKDAIYFFHLQGTAADNKKDDFAYLQKVIELGSRIILILPDEATYKNYMSLYGGAKHDRIHPYPDMESMIRDLHFRLKDY